MTKRIPQTPSFRLDGRRALVTGGSRGIGFACAAAFAQAGAHLTLAARSADDLESAARALRGTGAAVDVKSIDLGDIGTVEAWIDAEEPFDVLFNNAGVNRQGPMVEVTETDFDYVVDVNVKGSFFVAKAVARKMVAAGVRGSIIHTSSMMGHIAGPNRTAYVTSKHAIEGLTKAMAIEFGPHGIRVNSVAPAVIETELTAPILADPAKRQWLDGKTVLGRFGRVEDLMGPVLFLASDASAFITGTSLLVDGGWTAQ
jgi:NAD(P)-dependent dehydrogenase (short-subunit alcohol dehydrogenase family)